MSIRVFEINDMEWWAGDFTPEQMLAFYMDATGVTHEEATGDAEELPRALTDDEMDSLVVVTQDGKKTFREYLLQREKIKGSFPGCFAWGGD